MGCKSPHARTRARRVPRASSLEPEPEPRARARARARPRARARALVLGLGSWQLVIGWSLGCSLGLVVGLVLGPSCGLGPSLVGLVLFRPPPFPRQRAKRDATSSV